MHAGSCKYTDNPVSMRKGAICMENESIRHCDVAIVIPKCWVPIHIEGRTSFLFEDKELFDVTLGLLTPIFDFDVNPDRL